MHRRVTLVASRRGEHERMRSKSQEHSPRDLRDLHVDERVDECTRRGNEATELE